MPRVFCIVASLLLCIAPLLAQVAAPARLPVPSPAQQASARAMVREVFRDAFARTALADRRALAKTLFAQARDTRDDPPARYVLLADAADLAARAADAATACQALDALAEGYDISNLLDLKRQALVTAQVALAGNTADAEVLMRQALQTAQAAARLDDFTTVTSLANLAQGAAQKTLKVHLVSSIQEELQSLRDLAAEYEQVQRAKARLESTSPPASAPADRLLVGRFYALHKGDWAAGLPFLAQGADPLLGDLAAKELAAAGADTRWVELADAWWDYAQKAQGLDRQHATAHAQDLYRRAQATLTGITLARIQSRLGSTSPAATPAIDLLKLVDTARDACTGTWTLADHALACDSSAYATLQLPYTPPDEYDLTLAFTRTDGNGPVALLLAARGKAFGFSVDTRGEARFERINNKVAQDNPTVVPVAISNGRRYTLTVQVRKDKLRALLDGKFLVEHTPEPAYRDLSRYPSWKLTDPSFPGIGAHNARVQFHSIDLVEIAAKGQPLKAPSP